MIKTKIIIVFLEQIRISKRITAEDFNQPQYDLGGQQLQYYPHGQLCD